MKTDRTESGKLTPEYCAWANMNARCENTNRHDYKHYGGRGISVSDLWRHDYWRFLADMGRRPSAEHSLDRWPNPNGQYGPGNCRWANKIEQARNTRQTRFLTAFGETRPLREWAELKQINHMTLKSRLSFGWSPERALTEHLQTADERRVLVLKCVERQVAKRMEREMSYAL